jgi:hypothetical protein
MTHWPALCRGDMQPTPEYVIFSKRHPLARILPTLRVPLMGAISEVQVPQLCNTASNHIQWVLRYSFCEAVDSDSVSSFDYRHMLPLHTCNIRNTDECCVLPSHIGSRVDLDFWPFAQLLWQTL